MAGSPTVQVAVDRVLRMERLVNDLPAVPPTTMEVSDGAACFVHHDPDLPRHTAEMICATWAGYGISVHEGDFSLDIDEGDCTVHQGKKQSIVLSGEDDTIEIRSHDSLVQLSEKGVVISRGRSSISVHDTHIVINGKTFPAV